MRLEDGYYRLKGFSTDTAKSLELRWVKLLYFFVGHQIEVAFDPVLPLFLDSCKRSNLFEYGLTKKRVGKTNPFDQFEEIHLQTTELRIILKQIIRSERITTRLRCP
jgi:hypothetical protein